MEPPFSMVGVPGVRAPETSASLLPCGASARGLTPSDRGRSQAPRERAPCERPGGRSSDVPESRGGGAARTRVRASDGFGLCGSQKVRRCNFRCDELVGAAGIEPATICSQSRYATAALRPVGAIIPPGAAEDGKPDARPRLPLASRDAAGGFFRRGADEEVEVFPAGAMIGEVRANRQLAADARRRRRGDTGFLQRDDDVLVQRSIADSSQPVGAEAEADDVERGLYSSSAPGAAADEAGEVSGLAAVLARWRARTPRRRAP